MFGSFKSLSARFVPGFLPSCSISGVGRLETSNALLALMMIGTQKAARFGYSSSVWRAVRPRTLSICLAIVLAAQETKMLNMCVWQISTTNMQHAFRKKALLQHTPDLVLDLRDPSSSYCESCYLATAPDLSIGLEGMARRKCLSPTKHSHSAQMFAMRPKFPLPPLQGGWCSWTPTRWCNGSTPHRHDLLSSQWRLSTPGSLWVCAPRSKDCHRFYSDSQDVGIHHRLGRASQNTLPNCWSWVSLINNNLKQHMWMVGILVKVTTKKRTRKISLVPTNNNDL